MMSDPIPLNTNRKAIDIYDVLTLKLGHAAALLDVMATCDKGQCDVNMAAYGLSYMIEESLELANEFFKATTAV